MKNKINKTLEYLLIFLMAIMTLDVLWGVFTRYAMGSQASWTEELARFLLIWISILGAAYVSGLKKHLAIELLKPALSLKAQRGLVVLINVLIIVFALTAMVIGGSRLIYVTSVLGQRSAAMQIPMYLVYAVIPVSGLLVIYFKILDLSKLKHSV